MTREDRGVKRFGFLDLLFPPYCVGCGLAGTLLCERCLAPAGEPVHFWLGMISCVALGPYNGVLRRSVLHMKKGRRDVGERLGVLLAQRLGGFVAQDACLVPIPTTFARRAERGFDQAGLLARVVGCRLGRPAATAIERIAGPAQQGRTREERLRATGRFALRRGGAPMQGANVVLVDDVATTGATLLEAATVLEAGGARVRGGLFVACVDDTALFRRSGPFKRADEVYCTT